MHQVFNLPKVEQLSFKDNVGFSFMSMVEHEFSIGAGSACPCIHGHAREDARNQKPAVFDGNHGFLSQSWEDYGRSI